MELSEIRKIIQSIGAFYLQKNNGDVEKANEEVDRVRITKVEFRYDKNLKRELKESINITTMRPGLLIGARGKNIDALEQHINKKVHIIEEKDLGLLYSYEDPSNDELMMDQLYDEFMENNWLTEDTYEGLPEFTNSK